MKGFPIAQARAALAEDDPRVAPILHRFGLEGYGDSMIKVFMLPPIDTQAGKLAMVKHLYPDHASRITGVEPVDRWAKHWGSERPPDERWYKARLAPEPAPPPDPPTEEELLEAAGPDLLEACEAYYFGRKEARECELMMGVAIAKARGMSYPPTAITASKDAAHAITRAQT